ncbi:hypothetical protein V6N13_088173 [Hibiscus sabdariffa]|uniref:Uncharacterized protein n=1 Tax=Hibiscus sabdariffa TaxID=183260 RepID=A0ABR2FYM3_9ROSI
MMTREVNEFGRRLFTLRPGEDCERRPIPSGKPRLSVVQWHFLMVIKWLLSKGQGKQWELTQLLRALDMDDRAEEAH